MVRYLNTKLFGTLETVDQLDSDDFDSYKSFVQEKKRLISEYNLCGGYGDLYWSQRSTNEWKK